MHAKLNCYGSHGATSVRSNPFDGSSLPACKASCETNAECEAIVVTLPNNGAFRCWHVRNVRLDDCIQSCEADPIIAQHCVTYAVPYNVHVLAPLPLPPLQSLPPLPVPREPPK